MINKFKRVVNRLLYVNDVRKFVQMPRFIKQDGARRKFSYDDGKDFHFRADHVDLAVIDEIFLKQAYDGVRSEHASKLSDRYKDLIGAGETPLIIDCGSHIGTSTVYFSYKHPEARVVAVEPEEDNYDLLRLNTGSRDNIDSIKCAISDSDGIVDLHDTKSGSWGYSLDRDSKHGSAVAQVESRSIASIINEYGKTAKPFILKIDIEGGEENIDFSALEDTLTDFALIVIELHDWLYPWKGKSIPFLKFAASGNWDFLQKGENIFLYNRYLAEPCEPTS